MVLKSVNAHVFIISKVLKFYRYEILQTLTCFFMYAEVKLITYNFLKCKKKSNNLSLVKNSTV